MLALHLHTKRSDLLLVARLDRVELHDAHLELLPLLLGSLLQLLSLLICFGFYVDQLMLPLLLDLHLLSEHLPQALHL